MCSCKYINSDLETRPLMVPIRMEWGRGVELAVEDKRDFNFITLLKVFFLKKIKINMTKMLTVFISGCGHMDIC